MIKFIIKGDRGRSLIGLALSDENIRRLKNKDPILFPLDELGIEGIDVTIVIANNEKELLDQTGLKAPKEKYPGFPFPGGQPAMGQDDLPL